MIGFEPSPSPTRTPPRRRCATSTSTVEEGELCLVAGRTGVGQVDPARRDQRAGAALHRRHAGRPGHASPAWTPDRTRRGSSPTWSAWSARTRWPASSPTRSRRSWRTPWSSSASPPQAMRKRVEETLDLLGIADAAPPAAADTVRRAAAAGRDRRGADRRTPGAGAGRADLRAGPDRRPRTCWPRSPGWCTTSASPWWWPSTGWSGSCSTPTGWCCSTGDGRVASGAPADVLADRRCRAAGGRAGPAGRLDAAAAVGARRPPAGRPPAGRLRATPDGRAALTGGAPAHGPAVRGARRDAVGTRPRHRGPLRRGGRGRAASTSSRARRGGRADGPQRLRQVVPAVGAAGLGPPDRAAAARGRRRRPGDACRAQARGTGRAGAADRRPTCSTWTRSPPSARRPTRSPTSRRALPRAARPAGARASPGDAHPRDLSEGQRLRLVLAVQLTAAPPVVLLDEPTRGLDYPRQARARRACSRELAAAGPGGASWRPTTSSSSPSVADRVV